MFGILSWVIPLVLESVRRVNQRPTICGLSNRKTQSFSMKNVFDFRTTVLRGRAITPETLEELGQRLYDSLLQEASINFVREKSIERQKNVNIFVSSGRTSSKTEHQFE